MSDTGRLIINTRGESVQIVRENVDVFTLKIFAHYDRQVFEGGGGVRIQPQFTAREIRGVIIQLANAIGDAIELTPCQDATLSRFGFR